MKLEKLACNSCGAPLEVPESANYVTCNHCSTQLAVNRSESVTFTEAMDLLVEKTEEIGEQLSDLSLHNQLAALDRSWQLERENLMVAGPNGSLRIPEEAASARGTATSVSFLVLWTLVATGITGVIAISAFPFGVVALAFPAFGINGIVSTLKSSAAEKDKARRYRESEKRYLQKRAELTARLES